MLCNKRCLPYVIYYTRTGQSLGSWRRHAKQHVSFINFKPLELYWTYLLALQTTTPYGPWVLIHCLSLIHMLILMMSWGYDPNWWRENVDHESTSWSKDLVGHVSLIHVVEWDMSLFWILNEFTQKINNMLMWHGLPMK